MTGFVRDVAALISVTAFVASVTLVTEVVRFLA